MPYIPHTKEETAAMLSALQINSPQDLFDEIPQQLVTTKDLQLPKALTEQELTRLLTKRSSQDTGLSCFAGAGAYEHYIPSAVWSLASRGEFYSAYTPYQAEASQGTLQLLYEYQSMICALTGMQVSNASVYDGATALVEAVLMAVRIKKKLAKQIVLVPETLHPHYWQTLQTLTAGADICFKKINIEAKSGRINTSQLESLVMEEVTALILPQLTFHGVLEEVSLLTDWAHLHHALVIGVINPLTLGVLCDPGSWGVRGVDIVCGEGQPLGIPLSSGGPYFGLLATQKRYIRELPGRLVGKTKDVQGKDGYTLTLQAREQHIRRGKAKSNICTNQGLMVTAATIYLALLGGAGLKNVATICYCHAQWLRQKLVATQGVSLLYEDVSFHEFAVRLPINADLFIKLMSQHEILAGVALGTYDKSLENVLLICVTETKTKEDLAQYVKVFAQCLQEVL